MLVHSPTSNIPSQLYLNLTHLTYYNYMVQENPPNVTVSEVHSIDLHLLKPDDNSSKYEDVC